MIINFTLFNILYFIIIFSTLFIPIILSEIYNIRYFLFFVFYTNYFTLISSIYFVGKIIFSYLNYLKMYKVNMSELTVFPNVGIQITGWKEDPELFKHTLLSMKYQTYSNIKKIIFCSDGNDNDDIYMAEIFSSIFKCDSIIINNDKVFYDMNDNEKNIFLDKIKSFKYVCILQPHRGKRHGIYTQMKILNKCDDIDLIVVNDSDCVYNKHAIEYLVKTQVKYDLDAVSGDVKIYNIDSLVSFLSSLRYWFSMNLERNAQSYFNCVGCIPGPFGLFKNESIKKVIDIWIEQKLFGKECTFGDDRHLTNLLIYNKGKIGYNYIAKCYTDTPSSLKRFITQQTRWGKSFLREYIVNINSYRFDTLWLSFEQTFTFFIVYYVIYLMFINFYNTNLNNILVIYSSLLIFGYLRTICAILCTNNLEFIVFPLYGFLYFYILFPIKLWTLFTFNITSWGTGNRLHKTHNYLDLLFIIIWVFFTNICFIIAIITNINNFDYTTYITLIFILLNIGLLPCFYLFIFKKNSKKEYNSVINEYIKNFNITIPDILSIKIHG